MKAELGEQPGISLQTQTGTDHRIKTADEGARVECVLFAESMPCPGGNAPRASSKHLAALLFALEEFSDFGFTKERFVCTDVLPVWNRPHQRKADSVTFTLSTLKG